MAKDASEKEGKFKFKSVYEKFHELCNLWKVPLFLLELDMITNTSVLQNFHQVLMRRNYIQYGLMKYNRSVSLDRFRLHFETIGLKFFVTKSYSREHHGWVPAHYFLCGQNLTIHITMFYHKTPATVWHGNVAWSQELNSTCNITSELFVSHPGLYNKFMTEKREDVRLPLDPASFVREVYDSKVVECNYTRAEEFLMKHPLDLSEESQKFQRKARQVLARAKQYLDDLDIPFWLSSGTCLGWFRQCDIITYSGDVDLGILIKHFNAELVPAFERGGFFLKHVFGKVTDSYELSFQAGDIKLDLFFFYEEEDHMWNGGTHHETGQKYKYIFPKFSLCWTIFLELKLRVPCPPEPYIEANYGKNWMEPVMHWEWNKSPPNVRENGFWPKEEWEQVIQVF